MRDQYLYTGNEKTDITKNSHQNLHSTIANQSMKSKQGKEVNCLWWPIDLQKHLPLNHSSQMIVAIYMFKGWFTIQKQVKDEKRIIKNVSYNFKMVQTLVEQPIIWNAKKILTNTSASTFVLVKVSCRVLKVMKCWYWWNWRHVFLFIKPYFIHMYKNQRILCWPWYVSSVCITKVYQMIWFMY